MRTQLGSYCQQFDSTVRPVVDDLATAVAALDSAADGSLARSLRAPLCVLHQDLQALCDKVRDQQAFVLIFGPLKSGKSTLMNAIAATYVSEVSSLPAYPCLVFVRAGENREYVATSYDGSTKTFVAAEELSSHIDSAHRALADAVRNAERNGEVFDPQEHFPGAIRQVDVLVPDSELATDSTVLVDTPGLYTRMRFGYDRMTRDFRNAAACAIFVVRSDTLFLEQVFAEFEQLLELFSRIFLVVNIDANKRDVGPDGKLQPSLEQSQPEAVLKAFEQLAMSAPLQRAAREGRVKMYPVDLLHAASSVLQRRSTSSQPSSFRAFRQDLSEYLASQDYVAAFLRDSLQRGTALLDEAEAHATGDEARQLRAAIDDIDDRLAFLDAEHRRVRTALELDWTESFARSLREVEEETGRSARDHGAKLLRKLGASIDTWFLSGHSLEWLVTGQWAPLVADYRDDVHAAARRVFDQNQQQIDSGLAMPDGVSELLHRAGLDLKVARLEALASIGAVPWQAGDTVPVDLAAIPIRRGLVDLVAFRSVDKIRSTLFGSPSKPDRKIPGREKASRLGEAGRLHLHRCVAQFRADLTPRTAAVLRNHFGTAFQTAVVTAIRSKLEAYAPLLAERRLELEGERKILSSLYEPLARVGSSTAELKQKLTALRHQFERETTEKPVVLEPAARKQAPAKQAPAQKAKGQGPAKGGTQRKTKQS